MAALPKHRRSDVQRICSSRPHEVQFHNPTSLITRSTKMKRHIKRIIVASGFVVALTFGLTGQSAFAVPVDQDFGLPAAEQSAGRVIKIAPGAKWVNVTEGDR